MNKYFDFDPVDAAYLYGTSLRDGIKPAGALRRMVSFVRSLVMPLEFLGLRATQPRHGIVFFVTTKNQRDAVRPVIDSLKKKSLSSMLFSDKRELACKIKIGLYDLFCFYVLFFFWFLQGGNKFVRRLGFRVVIKSYFYYFCSIRIFKGFDGVAVFSNDHSLAPRSVFLGAKMSGVKTAYIQHAAVSALFPALKFDYAFLDGENSISKYRLIAERTSTPLLSQVFELGCPKADSFFSLSRQRRPELTSLTLGVAINLLDDIDGVIAMINELLGGGLCTVRFRPHPRVVVSLAQKRKLESLGEKFIWNEGESLEDFLAAINVLVAGDTGLHLEAVASGAVSLYTNFGSSYDDYYGFAEQGVSHAVEDIHIFLRDSLMMLSLLRDCQKKALSKFYNNAAQPTGASDAVAGKLSELVNFSPYV